MNFQAFSKAHLLIYRNIDLAELDFWRKNYLERYMYLDKKRTVFFSYKIWKFFLFLVSFSYNFLCMHCICIVYTDWIVMINISVKSGNIKKIFQYTQNSKIISEPAA